MTLNDLLTAEGVRFGEADVTRVTFDPLFR